MCALVLLAVALSGCGGSAEGQGSQTASTGGLIITEVMSNNTGSIRAPDGSTPDWIELYNSSGKTISLVGYMLSDNPRKPDKYVFKAGSLGAGDYLLVYATGKEAVSAGTMYLPFKLSGAGEELTVMAPGGKVSDRLVVPALPADVSYGRNGPGAGTGKTKVFYGDPTPKKENGTDGKQTAEAALTPKVTTLVINEFCTQNASLYDDAGDYPDWVELYNSGTEKLNLSGYGLTDDIAKMDKWQFPEVSIEPKGYLLVFLSGVSAAGSESKPDSKGRVRADFKLSGLETDLVVSDSRGRPVATAAMEDLPLNVSKGRVAGKTDTWAYFPRSTPGAANSTASFTKLSEVGTSAAKDVMVSEVFATDGASGTEPAKDWVELYNNTNKRIDLTGYGLSDSADDPYRMKLDDVSISAKSTLVVSLTDFAVSSQGETILLTDPTGYVRDSFDTGHLRVGTSSGRAVGTAAVASLTRVFFTQPTKNEPNTSTAYKAYTEIPTITVKTESGGKAVDGLYISKNVLVTIESDQPDAKIYYTLDGKKPSTSSAAYTGPIQVDHSLVVKAVAVRPEYLPSDPISRTLLKETPHSLPVVSLSGNPADLVGANGILVNGESTKETPLEFAFYEPNGQLGIDVQAGAELHGQFSRTEAQKSLELKFRSAYGANEITYPFFPGSKVNTFRRLVLRTSGQDWKFTKVRDAFMTDVVKGHLDLDYMETRYCVVYVNGQYWGIYDLREKLDQFYAASHYDVDPAKVDLIKGNNMVVAGTYKDMKDLIEYCKAHDLRQDAAYKSVLARIDEDSLIDWIIAESFFSNADNGNKKFWRVNSGGGQWHWMLFDLDWALFPSTYKSNRLSGDLLDPAGHGQGNWFSSTLQVKLIQNPAFRDKFITRYAKFLNTAFETDRMLKILDGYVDLVRDEMPRQIERWKAPSSVALWQKNVDTLRRITTEKRALVIATLQSDFDLSQTEMKKLFPKDF